jgi:1-acyl-sn-glycerol-3-phosphate acyltransferase
MMPRTSIRRPLTVTVWLIVSAIFVLISPLFLALSKLVSVITRRRQALVVTKLAVAYFSHELGALLACGAVWLATGGGRLLGVRRWQSLHWRLARWFFGGLADAGCRALEINVVSDPSIDAARALESDEPLIVLSRHAGPGDTVLIVNELMSRFLRRPSVVFKESLALDPSVDLLAHRLPHAMLDTSDREESEEMIGDIAAGLGPRGVVLLFPEGGNFTPERRRAALRHLRRRGNDRSADKAQGMSYVLPPRPAGALAALRANPWADIVFAAHTGLGRAAYPGQFWRDMPIGRTFYSRMWLVPVSEVPVTDDERVAWLYEWWKRIDEWIDSRSGTNEIVALRQPRPAQAT